MDSRSIFPIFPAPPAEYDQRYLQDVIRSLDAMVRIIKSPGEGRQTTLVLTDLPTSDVGLEYGSLYLDGNQLRVAMPSTPFVGGVSATGSVGTVTIRLSGRIPVTGSYAIGFAGSVATVP